MDTLTLALQDFFQDLLRKQESLGEEFQKVLDDNYWDLLVNDESSSNTTPE